jgi:UDP-N-acetylmuramoyl-L-alanyl-D-glutamate--2,6-diaminopimelate ligase
MEIIQAVAKGTKRFDKVENQDLFLIEDRREAIKKALNLAQENDLVLITGKGSEQAIVVKNGKKIDWDDRRVVKEILAGK